MPRTRTVKFSPNELETIRKFRAEIDRDCWQTVRNQIIDKYIERIEKVKQSGLSDIEITEGRFKKLSKNEQLTLALCFLTRLIELQHQGIDTEDRIQQLCQEETQLLERGYPKATIAKNRFPIYIKLVRWAILRSELLLNEQNSYTISVFNPETEAIEDLHCHYVQLYLKYETNFYLGLNKITTANNNIKQDNPKPVKLKPYLEKVEYLLHSPSYSELATGIALVTGRRFSELVLGRFSLPTNDPTVSSYQYLFSGQLKKSDTAEAFLTYSLIPASVLLGAIARFHSLSEIQSLISKSASPSEINETINSAVNYQVQQHFEKTGIVEVLELESRVTIHNLRGVYGEIATHFFCANRACFPRFLSFKLGHLIGNNAKELRNSPSTEHYFHYYLVDEDDRTIHSMGVKLAHSLAPVGDAGSLALQQSESQNEPDFFSPDKLREAIAESKRTILQIRLSTKQRFLSFQGETMNENDTLNLVLDKAEGATELSAKLQQASDLETALRDRIATFQEREIELQKRIATLEAQLKTRQPQLEKDRPLPEIEEKKTPHHLKTETESVAVSEPFSPRDNSTAAEDNSTLVDAVRLLVQSQSQLNEQFHLFLSRMGHTDSVSQSTRPSKQDTSSLKSNVTTQEDDGKTPHEAIINRAISLIIAYNNRASRHEDKWYIGVRPLKEIINYQPPITQVLQQRQDEIKQHHQQHNINQRHNAIHHPGLSYIDFFDFNN